LLLTFVAKVKKEMRAKAIEMSLAGTPWYREGMMLRTKKDTPVYDNSADIPGKLRGFNDVDGFLAAYAPGRNPDVWPPGTAKKIPAGATIRIQVHYSKVAGGKYDLGQGNVFTIVREGDKLIVISSYVKTRFELQPIGKDKFSSIPKLKMKSLSFATTKAKSSRYTSNLAEVRHAPGSSELKTNLNQH